MTRCKRVIILEGVDGSGKSTYAAALSKSLDAMVVHHGPYKDITDGPELARRYVDSMLPALLGEKDVILDRSWLSESIYGRAYRGGVDRLGTLLRRQLERLALRCGALVIRCDPGWDLVKASWQARKGDEYLKAIEQVALVHGMYQQLRTSLSIVEYNFTQAEMSDVGSRHLLHPPCHTLRPLTAGQWGASVVLVGESFAELKPSDHFYQWPFGSFSSVGCSRWLTLQLEAGRFSESALLWVNADQDLTWLNDYKTDADEQPIIITMGKRAWHEVIKVSSIPHHIIPVEHPQYWKRFRADSTYPLIKHLEALL